MNQHDKNLSFNRFPLKLRWEDVVQFTLLGILSIAGGFFVLSHRNIPIKIIISSLLIIMLGFHSLFFIVYSNILNGTYLLLDNDYLIIKRLINSSRIELTSILNIRKINQFYTGTPLLEIEYRNFLNAKIKKTTFITAMLNRKDENMIIDHILEYAESHMEK